MKKWIFPLLLGLGFLLGLGITFYPAVSNYLLERNQSVAMQGYIEEQEKVPDEVSEELKEEARAYNKKLREGTVVLTDPFDPDALKYVTDDYEKMLDTDGSGRMGYLEIPSIEVYLPIYHGTSEGVLQSGIGHLGNTSLPIGGENTHAVLSGHTGLPNARLLTDLDKLQEGDQFYIHVLDEILAYEVDQIKVVEPDDISDIFIEEGEDYVTLVTCTHQVKRQEESTWKQAYKEAIAEGVKWTLVGLAILAVLAGAGHLIGKAKKKLDKKKKGGSSA